jgi:hypothetical protein
VSDPFSHLSIGKTLLDILIKRKVTKLYKAKEVKGIQEIKKKIKKIKQTKEIKQDCLAFEQQRVSNIFETY